MNRHSHQNEFSNAKITLYALIIVFSCLLIFIIGFSLSFETTPKTFFKIFIRGLFHPTPNLCITDYIWGINLIKILYAAFFLILVTISCLGAFVKNASIPWKKLTPRILSCSMIIFMLCLCALQQISRLQYLKREQIFVHRNDSDISLIRQFTSQAKEIVPGRHQAKIFSDQDLSVDPYQLMQRTLSYYLYPEFSARFDNEYPQDCLFYFDKTNFTQGLPDDYKIIHFNPTGYFSIAVKKDLLKNAD